MIDEGVNLLHAVAGDEGGDLVRPWLNGETVMPRDVRPIIRDVQDQAGAALAAQGVDLDGDVVERVVRSTTNCHRRLTTLDPASPSPCPGHFACLTPGRTLI